MKLLTIALKPADLPACSAFAGALGMPFDVLLLTGTGSLDRAENSYETTGNTIPPADVAASGLVPLAQQYTHIAAPSCMASKDILGRLAGLLSAATVTDVSDVESPTRFVRPIVAGSILATVEVLATPVVLTFRPSSFPGGTALSAPGQARTLEGTGTAERVSVSAGSSSRPDLSQARIIVTGGRPLKDAGTFESVIGGLADALGGAVGATRAAVDSGIAPNEIQVGQTGKIVAPDLYIAAGVSGSTQHMAGIKDSKTIVAINTDPDAPIFESADLGLVQDLFTAIPELKAKLKG